MMKIIKRMAILFLVLISACSPIVSEQSEILNTPEIQYTSAPVPTATLDVQSTLSVIGTQIAEAQATANAVNLAIVQITEGSEQRSHEQLQMTSQSSQLTAQSDSWTATVFLTSFPATSTQQSISNTQISDYGTMQASQITAIADAPRIAMAQNAADNIKKYGFIEYLIKYVVFITIAFLFACLGFFFLRKPKIITETKIVEVLPPIIPIKNAMRDEYLAKVELKQNSDTPFPKSDLLVFPCTPEQMDELADKVINKKMSLAYDNFYGKESKFKRETYRPVYDFLKNNKLAKPAGAQNKGIVASELLEEILLGWLNNKNLPEDYSLETTPLSASNLHGAGQNERDMSLVQGERVQGTGQQEAQQTPKGVEMGQFFPLGKNG